MTATILDQLELLRELIETDQKTVDAISAHLRLIESVLKSITGEIQRQYPESPLEKK